MSDEHKKSSDNKKTGAASAFLQCRKCARKRAVQFLYKLDITKCWEITDESLANFKEMLLELDEDSETLSAQNLEKAMDYMEVLVKGVADTIATLDDKIRAAASNWRLERMSPETRCILRVATYEMLFVEKVSAATAINEAVELSKIFGEGDTPRFANGVLDRIRRSLEEAQIDASSKDAPAAETPATDEPAASDEPAAIDE